MLRFNDILAVEGVDPRQVLLVRHQDARLRRSGLYNIWRTDRDRFEGYQRLQSRDRFRPGALLASFVVTPPPRAATLLVGLFRVDAVDIAPTGTVDPILGTDAGGLFQYVLSPDLRLDDYTGKLVIDWGAGTRAWVQRADRNNKPVREIQVQDEPPFPGFTRFRCPVEDLPGLYPSWVEVLKNVKGVYILVDVDSGKQYVGSAKGEESLLGRWMSYADGSGGGNVELIAAGRRNYQVAVLEVVGATTPDERIEDIEAAWKDKLLTRRPFGLNAN